MTCMYLIDLCLSTTMRISIILILTSLCVLYMHVYYYYTAAR